MLDLQRQAAPPPAVVFDLRLYFYEPLVFKHPQNGRSLFIDVNSATLIFVETWGGFFSLG